MSRKKSIALILECRPWGSEAEIAHYSRRELQQYAEDLLRQRKKKRPTTFSKMVDVLQRTAA